MKKSLLLLTLLAGLSPLVAQAQNAPPTADGSITMIGDNGKDIGTATIRQGKQSYIIELALTGLIQGWHGVQLHSGGDCSDTAAFERSGPEIARRGQHHGLMNPAGPFDGDLPNIWIGSDGTGKAQFSTGLVSPQELFAPTGSTIIIRAAADDQKTEPDGQSGTRVGCGIIAPAKVAP